MPPQQFFAELKDESTANGTWFKGIKKNMERMIAARKMAAGDSFDKSSNEIFLEHVKEMCAAFARADTSEAAARKLAVKTLWRSAGRASEPAALSYKTLRWNSKFLTPRED